MYAIINKKTKEYFAGFGKSNKAVWTSFAEKAWTSDRYLMAECQAGLLAMQDKSVQKKPVNMR